MVPKSTLGFSPPSLSTRRVSLRAAGMEDSFLLRELAVGEMTAHRWRLRGAVPSPQEVDASAWAGVVAQFVISPAGNREERIGVTQINSLSLKNRHAYFAMALLPRFQRRGWPLDAALLTIDYAFQTWDLRKIYAELPQVNFDEVAAGAGSVFEHEATLGGHEFIAGEYQDTHIISVTRSRWADLSDRWLVAR